MHGADGSPRAFVSDTRQSAGIRVIQWFTKAYKPSSSLPFLTEADNFLDRNFRGLDTVTPITSAKATNAVNIETITVFYAGMPASVIDQSMSSGERLAVQKSLRERGLLYLQKRHR